MKKTRLIPVVILSALLAACATSMTQAPVVSRTSQSAEATAAAAPPAGAPVSEGHGYYRVKKGDTLFRIAVDVGQNYKDIVTWNNLANPNDIKVDQMLRVLPPDAGAPAVGGVQLGAVGGGSSVEVKPLGAPSTVAGTPAADSSLNKNGPRGDKRPYSDATLAELEKPDAAVNNAPAPAQSGAKTDSSAASSAPSAPGASGSLAAPAAAGEEAAMDWMWPAEGKVIGNFSTKKGIDIAGKSGQSVMAAGAGKVMYAGAGIRGYGNLVIVKHSNNLLSAYAHNKTILVKEGQQVTKGQKIAEMGNSDSDSVMLHFEIRQQGKPVDPAKYLPPR
ncbi:MAG TPA: peptidoglycan DD-metalloendopeptidase family protein [Herbaspirillum sp.]